MSASTPKHVLSDIWRAAGHPEAALGAVDLTGNEPVLPSSFRVGTAAQATIAAAALAASELWRLRRDRIPQRTVLAHRWKAPVRVSRPDRGTVSLRRRPLGAASHQFAASSRWGP